MGRHPGRGLSAQAAAQGTGPSVRIPARAGDHQAARCQGQGGQAGIQGPPARYGRQVSAPADEDGGQEGEHEKSRLKVFAKKGSDPYNHGVRPLFCKVVHLRWTAQTVKTMPGPRSSLRGPFPLVKWVAQRPFLAHDLTEYAPLRWPGRVSLATSFLGGNSYIPFGSLQ